MKKLSRAEAIREGKTRYFTGKTCKHGHVSERMVSTKTCVTCKADREKKRPKRILTEEQRARKNDLARARRKENPEKYSAYSVNWYRNNKVAANKARMEYHKKAMKESPEYAIRHRVSALIKQAIKARNFSKDSKTAEILGCSNDEFRAHIERQFTDGMSWENRDKWHLDHIIPVSSGATKQDIYALNHYTNLRPMWASDNLRKSNKMEYLI